MSVSDLDAPFWAGLGEFELRLPRCATCHVWRWPPQHRCQECGSFLFYWDRIEADGIVYSWTRTWYPYDDRRANEVPYVVVLAEIRAAGNARVLGTLMGSETGLAIGAPVRGVFESNPDGPLLRWRLQTDGC